MGQNKLRTREEVKNDFLRKGVSIRGWAKHHGINHAVVSSVLNGRLSGRIGESHKAAVLLGIKDGEIVEESGDE